MYSLITLIYTITKIWPSNVILFPLGDNTIICTHTRAIVCIIVYEHIRSCVETSYAEYLFLSTEHFKNKHSQVQILLWVHIDVRGVRYLIVINSGNNQWSKIFQKTRVMIALLP